mgnify:CR=1 FL=1
MALDQLDEAVRNNDTADYELPSLDLLLESDEFSYDQQEKEVRRKAKVLEKYAWPKVVGLIERYYEEVLGVFRKAGGRGA